MFKRFVGLTVILAVCYLIFVIFRVSVNMSLLELKSGKELSAEAALGPTHKVYNFSFTKYATEGKKELELEATSANIFERVVKLENVIAKAYSQDSPVTITADTGVFDKSTSVVHLENNVVATTETGGKLLTHSLDIYPSGKYVETEDQAQVKKDNLAVEGLGARGESDLNLVVFRKNVTVVVQSQDEQTPGTTVITCRGPLEVDYKASRAHFMNDVVATHPRGKLASDTMDVFFNKDTSQVEKILCVGNVVITDPDGNESFSDRVLYLAEEGRIVLTGEMEGIYYPGEGEGTPTEQLFLKSSSARSSSQ